MKECFLIFDPKDNVAVACKAIKSGTSLEFPGGNKVTVVNDIQFAHKFALRDLTTGDKIYKYGEVIGIATTFIGRGEHVHIHNIQGSYLIPKS